MSNLLQNYARFDLEFVKGEGATLFSKDGREFIDFASGIGVVSLGHGNLEFGKAISEQVGKLVHVSNLYQNSLQEKLASEISKLAGFPLYSFFANSGAEANEGAIKIARKYGKGERFEIISLKDSFHGRTLGSLSATGQEFLQTDFKPMLEGFKYVEKISEIAEAVSENTVAVMIELIRGEGGVEALRKEEVLELAKFLKSRDILLIVDEVQSGVFRTGKFLASNHFGIEPDIITLAKGIGNGFPIGVVATKLENGFSAGDHGSTFGGNYLATSSALKTLEILQREEKKVLENIELFSKELEKSFGKERLTGLGLMRGVKLDSDVLEFVKRCHSQNLLTLKSGNNTLRFLPPLLISEKEIKSGFEKIKNCLKG